MYSHGHTRLEILGGWQESALFMLKAPGPIGGFEGMLPERNLIRENSVFLMPFPGFLSGFFCIEQVTNEKKILGISMKQNLNRKIAQLFSKNCPTNFKNIISD